ncbi:MAG: hypothetical protein KatS3mg008_1084 [Acidimicrobiales bacterium]|nr:MAG: hypothetical protein KatS3mg008_1084 [Acidimicrobiales bacterium]
MAKEVAIYEAHKAAVVVIAPEGERRFESAHAVIEVPRTHPDVAFVLTALAGHLFGYEAALAIDGQARLLREARAAIEQAISQTEPPLDGHEIILRARPALRSVANRFFRALRAGEFDGHLEPSTAVRLSTCLRFALGDLPLDAYQTETGRLGTPAVVLEDLTLALTEGIEQLTRPIDAIKHQAKTVTVGISRADEGLLTVRLVRTVLDAGADRDRISYDSLKALAAIDGVVDSVLGWTRYRVEGDVDGGGATAVVVDRGGISVQIPSRTESDPRLRGTKHRVAVEKRLLVAKGRRDGRTFVIVPEVKDGETTGLTLVHVAFAENPPVEAVKAALDGYRNRLAALRDVVLETEEIFDETVLTRIPVADLLCDPIYELADRWRGNGGG